MGLCSLEGRGAPLTSHASAGQVDSIHALLKGAVMSRAFEETKHFPMDHSLQGEHRGAPPQGSG